MTSLQFRTSPEGPLSAAVLTAAQLAAAPPLPETWVRKVREADARLQERMRVVVAGAIALFIGWAGWALVF